MIFPRFSTCWKPGIDRRTLSSAAGLVIAAVCLSIGADAAAATVEGKRRAAVTPQNNAAKPDPDILLIEVYKSLAANKLRDAQRKADALVEAYPTFHLGHLIRGDLLLMNTRSVSNFGEVRGADEKLNALRHEAIARMRSLRERPDPELVPRPVMQLREDQKHVLVVDAKRSRLFVYENQRGKLRFVTDYYISQGKLGVNKLREGDQKTPLGVYYITSRVDGAKLPDFYGPGALPISYPNEWDKRNGRSGSGIWLHGVPSGSFSRPPLSSDGCVVLTNQDLNKLMSSVEIGKTPVVISDQVEFVSRASGEADRGVAKKLLDEWTRDLLTRNPDRLKQNYSTRFRSDQGENLNAWFSKQDQWLRRLPDLTVSMKEISFFRYPGQDDLIVGTFTQEAVIGKTRHSVRKRQYWEKEGSHWKIVAETSW